MIGPIPPKLLTLKYSITIHKIIAVLSLLILSSVQFFLLYNTYELKNDNYLLGEKSVIYSEYTNSIKNDKVMPGGVKILDRFIAGNMRELERTYLLGPDVFNSYKQKVCDSAFTSLRMANNMDSLLEVIVRLHHLNKYIRYALIIRSLEVSFQHDKYVPLVKLDNQTDLVNQDLLSRDYIKVGGTLQDLNPQNLVRNITVSTSMDYSYLTSFSLYVDTYNRKSTILKLMMPTFLLSLLSVSSVVLIFFVTFRNWLKQKKLSEMKSDFINSITHEFHTPLSAIIVANRTMQNEKIIERKENIRPLTEVIQRQADRLKTLIGQVLQITTMNKMTLQKGEYSVNHLLDELLLDYRLNIMEINANLVLHKNAQRDVVMLDQFWFTTIILNIFDNAVKYNDRAFKEIIVSTSSDKKGLYITIGDNGIGMSEEVKKHIFDKFYRRMNNSNSQVKGLGLGLYYVKQAIDAHNWRIDIESMEGAGSVFTISIPF